MPTGKGKEGGEDGVKMAGFRLPRELHAEAKHRAVDENITLAELLRRALQEYLDRQDTTAP